MKEAAEQMLGGFVFCSAPVCLVEGREDGGEVAVLDTAVSHHAAGGVVVQHGFADKRELQGLADPEPADEDGRAVDDLEDVGHLRVGIFSGSAILPIFSMGKCVFARNGGCFG